MTHKAGIVNIIGLPNAGKSTLLNAITGEHLSIVTHKASTTRHRLKAILNTDDYQIIFFDTPGIIKPDYELHRVMMKFVEEATEDTDVILLLVDARSRIEDLKIIHEYIMMSKKSLILAINKSDLKKPDDATIAQWKESFNPNEIILISALHKSNLEELVQTLLKYLPEHPAYFDKDEITDRPVRFFIQEIIREKILINFHEEIPYSVDVYIEEFKEKETITVIRAIIIVERESQKAIILGHGGAAIKHLGTVSREVMEKFLERKVFLDLSVKVKKDWRNDIEALKRYGYK